MCNRRKNPRKRNKKNQRRNKREHSCKRRCYQWICRKIKRRIKRKIFGQPNVGLDDFEFAGINLGSIRDKLKGNQSKTSFTGTLKNTKELKKKFSLTKSKVNILDVLVEEIKKGKVSVSQLAKIELEPKKLNKAQLNKMLDDFEESRKKRSSIKTLFWNKYIISKLNINDIDMIDGLNAKDLMNDFNIGGSKAKLLEKMVTDYKKGRLSLPGLSHKSKFDGKSLTKSRINKMLENYDIAQKKNIIKEVAKNPEAVKKKYSITKSKENILDDIANDYYEGRISKTLLAKVMTINTNNLTKEKVHRFLEEYARTRKEKDGKQMLHNLVDRMKHTSVHFSTLLKK